MKEHNFMMDLTHCLSINNPDFSKEKAIIKAFLATSLSKGFDYLGWTNDKCHFYHFKKSIGFFAYFKPIGNSNDVRLVGEWYCDFYGKDGLAND